MARTKKEEIVEEVSTKRQKNLKKDFILTVGKRKAAVARVRLYSKITDVSWGEITLKKGDILVNKKSIGDYFSGLVAKAIYEAPLKLTKTLGEVSATISVSGGGTRSQLEAVVHGLSRALSELDREKYRGVLKKEKFLTRDSRIRERRKVGMGGKSRRKRQSPKR